MTCKDCRQEVGFFDELIPIFQMRLDGEGVELSGYAHAWHFKPVEDRG